MVRNAIGRTPEHIEGECTLRGQRYDATLPNHSVLDQVGYVLRKIGAPIVRSGVAIVRLMTNASRPAAVTEIGVVDVLNGPISDLKRGIEEAAKCSREHVYECVCVAVRCNFQR